MTHARALPPGVRFIQRDWLSANHVLLLDDESQVLVDTGFVTDAPRTLALLEAALAAEPPARRRIDRIVNTHLHSDHCGGNAAVHARYGCRITVPAGSFVAARDWDQERLSYRDLGQPCPRFPVDDALAPGDELHVGGLRWVAHAAPGHDPDSLVLFAPEARVLVSADALWANGFGILFPELRDESGFAEEHAVLELIETLAPRLVLPGHGPMFDDVPAAVARARRRLEGLASDPQRHARHALKALIKFRLLYKKQETLADMVAELEAAELVHEAARQAGMPLVAALEWATDELVAAGQVVRRGTLVIDGD